MPTVIHLSDDGTYVELVRRGEISRQSVLAENLQAHALGRAHGVRSYLVDHTEARSVDSLVDQYDFAYHDMREAEGLDQGARIAVLITAGDRSHDFIETVCRNAGFDVQLFTDRAAAVRFLRGR
ncbi:MAG: hypothetical protein KJ058_02720 [Thermoanaerobaculia bacterium]|nr:hypothetical protein [Thermoanaerobaculia bacterium]